MTTTKSPGIEGRLETAVQAARQAGELTLGLFRSREIGLEQKPDGSPVTAADRQAERLLRDLIAKHHPADAILGEEYGEQSGSSGYRWVLDPIDGTKSFVAGVPLYTTLVAVMKDDRPLAGVIFAPAAGEMIYAANGSGCWHVVDGGEPQPAHVSDVAELGDAVFVTSSVRSYTADRPVDARPVYDQLQSICRFTRTWGDAYGYLLVATGRAEIMIDPVMNLWDTAALQPVIEEAGGKFFDWQGRPTVHSGEAVATNAALAEQVQAVLRT